MNPTINVDDLTYDYRKYDNGVWGKCVDIPAISAQGKTQDEVCGILHEMVKDYFDLKNQRKTKHL